MPGRDPIYDAVLNGALGHDRRDARPRKTGLTVAPYPEEGPPPGIGVDLSQPGPAGEKAAPVEFPLIDSATFATADYPRDFLVKGLLVRGQPAVAGGPAKSLKTSLLVDLALSLGTATSFLDTFVVPAPVRVTMLSGESGEATLQETARRVATAKRIDLATASVFWGFRLPQLASVEHLDAVRGMIERHRVEVMILDPLYLSLLAGTGPGGPQASNLYQTGPLLMAIANACLEEGCTPILAHHFKLTRADRYGEPQLGDLAFSGIGEFARQWLLLGRREEYQPGSGEHRLWFSAGGSAGHGGLWSLDVNEGAVDDWLRGRRWEVAVTAGADARKRDDDAKTAQRDRDDDAKLLKAVDDLTARHGQAPVTQARTLAGLSGDRSQRAAARLVADGVLSDCVATIATGTGRKVRREVPALCRAGHRATDGTDGTDGLPSRQSRQWTD